MNEQEVKLLFLEEENKVETYLTEENVLFLKQMFKDKKSYSYYMRSLWILRNIARSLCERETSLGIIYDRQHEMFPVFEMTNELMGALYRENIYLIERGDKVDCIIDDEVYNIYTID